MRMRWTGVVAVAAVLYAAAVVQAQAPSPAAEPTEEQLRQAVSRIRGNRIAVPVNYDALTPAQQAYVRSILSGPRPDISGPLAVMMVSPGLGDLAQKAMAYSRFAGREGFSSVPPRLNELAILIVAKHWSANYVWNAHHRYAVQMGLPQAVVDAVRTGARPPRMEPDVAAVYEFATAFLATRRASDAQVAAARAALGGDRGIVDLVGTLALYQMTAMMTVLDQTPLAPGTAPFFD
jgi:4-carboxymuconolactone decarboxylase